MSPRDESPAPTQGAPGAAPPSPPAAATNLTDEEVLRRLRVSTRRSFLVGALAVLGGGVSWWWLRSRELDDGIPWPLRQVLRLNERLGRTLFREQRLAPTFTADQAANPMRLNGYRGLSENFDPTKWELDVAHADGRRRRFRIEDVRAVPRTGIVTEMKCIEGWSQIFSWSGPSLRDFMVHYRLGTRSGGPPDLERGRDDLYHYVALATPDGGYYVGLDMESALHPQTLLCDEMGGEPLSLWHGAPLRLAIPVKYGIKNIKRIGRIVFTDERPADYWAERGYDWYSGH